MSNYKIFICGNFGYVNNHLDGQTVKTRVLKDELIKRLGDKKISFTDTSFIKSNPFAILNEIRKNFNNSTHIIMMPDTRAFQILLPLYVLGKKNKDIRYVVIGGWLPSFLCVNKLYAKLLSKLNGVYVETTAMKEKLDEIGLVNSFILPNFRYFDHRPDPNNIIEQPLKLVYFSRVLKEKGIELAIEAVNKINEEANEKLAILDIFGPIQKEYKIEFERLIKMQNINISYKGVLQLDEIHKTLSKYNLMLFPTYYCAEGFPGTIIDSYISGVPVIASDWAYNKEFVLENKTGMLFKPQNVDDLVLKIRYFLNNTNIIKDMRHNCMEKALDYHVDNLIPKLISDMKLD